MPLERLLINGEELDFDQALEEAKAGRTDLPFPFLKAIISAIRTRQATADDQQVSVTDVVGCPRAKYLKANESYSEEPENLMAAFRGQLMHQLLATYAQDEAVVETRTSRDFGGYTLYGTADSIITTRNGGRYKLTDYKTTKRIPQYGPWTNHVQQVNLYRWLYELPAGNTDLAVVYFDLNGAEVAKRPVKQKDHWSDDKVEEFLTSKFVPLAKAMAEKKVPLYRDVPADITSWMCSWCPVYQKCYDRLLQEPGALPAYAEAARSRGRK